VDIGKSNMGWIEVVVGRVFRHDEELIRRCAARNRAPARADFKPAIDERYAANESCHKSARHSFGQKCSGSEIMEKLLRARKSSASRSANSRWDEVVDVAPKLANIGKRVIVPAWIPITEAAV